jgi:hypothetical protein
VLIWISSDQIWHRFLKKRGLPLLIKGDKTLNQSSAVVTLIFMLTARLLKTTKRGADLFLSLYLISTHGTIAFGVIVFGAFAFSSKR